MSHLIDFTPVQNKELLLHDFAQQFSPVDLLAATHASLDLIRSILLQADDAAIAFAPHDPNAHDAYAQPGEETIGWTLGHLVCHVTASSEEYANYASLLARSIPYGKEPRLRFETDWRLVTTQAAALQRLEESRRIRTSLLTTFPDQPNFDVVRDISERYRELFGEQNAKSAYLLGLYHEWQHHDQFREVLTQALAAQGKTPDDRAADTDTTRDTRETPVVLTSGEAGRPHDVTNAPTDVISPAPETRPDGTPEEGGTPNTGGVSTSAPSTTASSESGMDIDPRGDTLGG